MNRSWTALLTCVVFLMLATPAAARDDFYNLPVKKATESDKGKETLLHVPFYMAGQKHARVDNDLGTFKANRRTNAFNKSDERACNIAVHSPIISLQERARKLGGDAVVDIKSITKNQSLVSATEFRCVAGNVVANVALTGRIVKFKS